MNLRTRLWFKTIIAVAALLTLSTVPGTATDFSAQFSLTGWANDTLYGYTNGLSYTFYWIVNSSFTNNDMSGFISTENYWADTRTDQAPIFSGAGGDGLTGSWQRPVIGQFDPYSFITVSSDRGYHALTLLAGNDAGYSVGLQANGTGVYGLWAYALEIGDIFSFPMSYTNPNNYFAGLTGTYAVASGSFTLQTVGTGALTFTPASLTISTIPEPSTGLLTGLGLVVLLFRRRLHAR